MYFPNDLPVLILDGALKKVTQKKHASCTTPNWCPTILPPTQLVCIVSCCLSSSSSCAQIDVLTGKKHAPIQTPSEGGANSEVLAEVAWNWPQRVSHAQKDAIVRDFCSVTSSWPSTQAPKSITCASCAERVRHDKQCVIRLVSYSLCTVFCEYDVCGPGLCRLPALCLIRKTGDIYISAVYVEGFH